jgi:hypothetical protein
MYYSLPVFIEEFLASFMSLLLASSVPLCAAVSCPFISIIFLPEPNTGFAAERSFPRFRTVSLIYVEECRVVDSVLFSSPILSEYHIHNLALQRRIVPVPFLTTGLPNRTELSYSSFPLPFPRLRTMPL